MAEIRDVQDFVRGKLPLFLKEKGFDGIYNESRECACELDDLEPCEEMDFGCEFGYFLPKDHEDFNPEYDFMIVPDKHD